MSGGGAERVQLTLLNNLDRSVFDISVFYLRDDGVLCDILPPDIAPEYGVRGKGRLKLRSTFILAKIIKMARRSDVIFGMQDGTPIYLAVLVGLLSRKPVVGWIHNTWSVRMESLASWHRVAFKILYGFADRLIAVSDGAAKDMERLLPSARGRILHHPNPVPLLEVRAKAEVETPAWANVIFRKPTILAVGRLVPAKGFDVLLKAFARVVASGFDANLLILGDGAERPRLQTLAAELRLGSRIVMPGFQTNPYPFFGKADLFVLSSRYEGLPTVVIEALALGLPIVASDCPSGPRELLRDGDIGILVAPEDVDGMADAIARVLGSRSFRESLRRAALARAEEFDCRRLTESFGRLLSGVGEGRPW